MAVTSGFFNSVNGDRVYSAEDMSHYFEGIVSDGVFESIGDRFAVTPGGGMSINIGTGRALVNCHWIKSDAIINEFLEPSDLQLSRLDAIVLRLDLTDSGRKISIEIVKGESSLQRPDKYVPKQTESVKELVIAYVRVLAKSTEVTQSDIIDMRGSSYCSWVTGVVKQVDTSDLFLQYQTAYETMRDQMEAWQKQQQEVFELWFNSLTDSLHVDTSLKKYEYSYTTTKEETVIPLIDEHEAGDILLVHINGVLFVEGDEYTIADNEIHLTNSITSDNTVTQILIKAVIGQGVISNKIDEINGEVV